MNYDENGPDTTCDHGHEATDRHAEEAAYRATRPDIFPVAPGPCDHCLPEAWQHEFYHYERLRRANRPPVPAGYAHA